jgi:signal transduction histidine kinase
MKVSLNPFAPQELLDYVYLVIRPLAEQQGLTFTCQLDHDLPPTLLGDIHHLQEIMTNLIGNAVKFTDTGQIDVLISKEGEAYWGIHVKDTGIGIPAGQLDAIFNPFQQADGTIRRSHGGTGLGLSIAKQVAELMDGDIKVHSIVGKGTHFTVWN